jgi:hypothetical protein
LIKEERIEELEENRMDAISPAMNAAIRPGSDSKDYLLRRSDPDQKVETIFKFAIPSDGSSLRIIPRR